MVWRSILHVVNVKLNPKLVTLDQSETVISHQKTDVRYKYALYPYADNAAGATRETGHITASGT